jgi:hypothetical protein
VYSGGAWLLLSDNSYIFPDHEITLDKTGIQTLPSAIVGYGAQMPMSVTITNTGKQNTGALTIGLSGANQNDFTLNVSSIAGIASGGVYTFTIVPNTGLAVGAYAATVTVSGVNVADKTFVAHFTVNAAAAYGISLSQSASYTFPAQPSGYGDQAANALSVTVSNTGNQDTGGLTVSASPTNRFLVSPASISNISAGNTAAFTVKPQTGLATGTYSAALTVSGGVNITSQSFNVSFTVNLPAFAAPPVITGLTSTSAGVLSVYWSAASPAPDSYRVYWKKGTHTETAVIKTGPDNGSTSSLSSSTSSYAITGLTGAAYSVFVEATKSGYSGGESGIAVRGILTGTPVLSITGVTENSVSYSINNSGLVPAGVDGYEVYYLLGNQNAANVLGSGTKHSAASPSGTISGLIPGEIYSITAVAVKDAYSNSVNSNLEKIMLSSAINLAAAIPDPVQGRGWKYADNVYTILEAADITVSGATATRRLEAASGATASLALNNASITGITTGSAFKLHTGANITMTLAGTNALKTASAGRAGAETTDASLLITGTGSLDVLGANWGAGIGGSGSSGGSGGAGGTIRIEGSAVVTAQGGSSSYYGSGAGIGGGGAYSSGGGSSSSGGAGGSITMSDSAVVTAYGVSLGAGIGGGGGECYNNSLGSSGSGGAGGLITIAGGTVIARQGSDGAPCPGKGIGGGGGAGTYRGNGAEATINLPGNAVVFASSADSGLANNLANGVSVGSATVAIDGVFPSINASVTLQADMTIPAGGALTVPAGVLLNKNGKTITGSVVNAGGTIYN